MSRSLPFLIVLILFFSSCNDDDVNIGKQELGKPKKSQAALKTNKTKKPVPVRGYRFVIIGDFDGDGKKDTLTEHYFSRVTGKETNKFYQNMNYDELVKITGQKKPRSFLVANFQSIGSLEISKSEQQLGLAYLKNEGDLNGDGGDEVSYVVCWADWSNVNSCNIVTYKNGKWKVLYSFRIWDWQLPDLPETYNEYGLMGLANKFPVNDDNANRKILLAFKNFKGLIKKKGDGKVQITYMTDEAELDSVIVDLKSASQHKR